MKSKTRYVILIFVLSLNILFPAMEFNSTINESIEPIKFPKQSAGFDVSFIHVDGNWTDTTSYDWCYFESGYYIIENVTIDASNSPTGSGILINNSKNDYFIIRNCMVFNADDIFFDSGIWMENTNNGTIFNNDFSDNNLGIYLIGCEKNNIMDNTVNNNGYNGIYLDTDCFNNNITGNTANNNIYGIQLYRNCDYNNVSLNNVAFNEDYGIYLNSHTSSCDNNLLVNNIVNDNNRYGIYFTQDNNENSVINNTIFNNLYAGVYVHRGHYNNLTGNVIYENEVGIDLADCDNMIITDNTVNNNLQIGIIVQYNSDNNVVKNNTVNQNDLGIRLDNCDYNNVTGNILYGNNWCIYETDCIGNIIEYNDCTSPTIDLPIYIDDYAVGVGAHNWTWAEGQPWCSGSGTLMDPYIISNLEISGFGTEKYGIDIRNSNAYFIIQDCTIYNADEGGIYLDNVNNSLIINNDCSNNANGLYIEYSNYITIFGNNVNENDGDGIYIYESNYLNVSGNIINNNDDGIYLSLCNFSYFSDNDLNANLEEGIYLEECFNNTISRNTANNNDQGIYLWDNSNNNRFFENIATGNYDGFHSEESNFNIIVGNSFDNNDRAGIYLYRSEENIISENSVNNNLDGLFLEDENYHNLIAENTFNYNNIGIEIYYSDYNIISYNVVNNNDYSGIETEVGNFNEITGNLIKNNVLVGIDLDADSNNNSIFQNFFVDNGLHAVDNGLDNKWNSTLIGNYWDNWTSPDADNDGIVDIAYTYIGGTTGSVDYLPIAEDGAPTIIINLPTANQQFSSEAPAFNIEIIDIYVLNMWYTLDGGLTNFTFTENGTINQLAWDELPEGNVVIRFYAEDIVGNKSYAEVTVIKQIGDDGINPILITIIVVVSIIGGIAIVGATYWYLKRYRKSE